MFSDLCCKVIFKSMISFIFSIYYLMNFFSWTSLEGVERVTQQMKHYTTQTSSDIRPAIQMKRWSEGNRRPATTLMELQQTGDTDLFSSWKSDCHLVEFASNVKNSFQKLPHESPALNPDENLPFAPESYKCWI